MNVLDLVIIICFICFLLVGLKRGVIKETVSLVGIIIVFVLSFSLKGVIGNILCYLLPFFQFGGVIEGITTINIFLYQMIAFLMIFSLLMGIYIVCLKISKFIQKIVNMTIILWIPSKILGGFVSLIKGYLIIYALLLVIYIPFSNVSFLQDSILMKGIVYHTPVLSSYTRSFISPLEEVYDLGKKVAKEKISTKEANTKSLDIMLKYKVVSKDTVKRLISLRKIDSSKEIEELLERY